MRPRAAAITEVDVQLLDSAAKIDDALQQEPLSSTASQSSDDTGNQREEMSELEVELCLEQ
jgi:hypothetical protein